MPPWLNQVELWFAKTERDPLARGVFTSVSDLARRIVDISVITKDGKTGPLELSQSSASHS